MNHKNDKEVNDIAAWNLLDDKINPYKCSKNIKRHFTNILHGWMHIRNSGREKYKTFESYWTVDVVTRL